jgi:hypothetical protein
MAARIFGPDDDGTGRACDVAGKANWYVVEAEHDGVGKRQLDLRLLAHETEDAEIRNEAAARSDDGNCLLGGEVAFLKQRPIEGELRAWSE